MSDGGSARLRTIDEPDTPFYSAIKDTFTSQREPVNSLPLSSSHRLDMIEAFSFVSAWDLYLIALAEASSIIVIGSSEDPENCLRSCVCACECVRVCASPVEDRQQTASSMIVPREGSQ